MKHIKNFENFLGQESGATEQDAPVAESLTMNDPVLMALRASMEDRKKELVAQQDRAKKRVYGKKRTALEDSLWSISQELKDLYSRRSELLTDMEEEAGKEGLDNFEKSGRHDEYGKELNDVDTEIQNLITKRIDIETKLAY